MWTWERVFGKEKVCQADRRRQSSGGWWTSAAEHELAKDRHGCRRGRSHGDGGRSLHARTSDGIRAQHRVHRRTGLIFVSEVGDKTFFIAALLAMKRGAAAVLAGSMLSLGAMTAISVVIGRVLKGVPDSIQLTVPVGEYLAVALLVFFGLKSINEALKMPGPFMGAQEEVTEEWKEAEKEVEDSETKSTTPKTFWATMVKTAGLIFVAEWGDRSMLATIALGAAQNPVGVFTGAFIGHLVATAIAVGGGAFLSKWVNEKFISFTGGILFLLFAVATVVGVF
eukprot:jgi/Pico_ML_1/52190/g2929.t1